MKNLSIAIFLILSLFVTSVFAKSPENFTQAKKLARIIWSENRIDQYCGCKFDKHLNVDLNSCDYIPRNKRAAMKISWEHIVPVASFGKPRNCWQNKICSTKNGDKYRGRKCCEKIDLDFKKMSSDLRNLIPVISEVNSIRRDYNVANLNGDNHLNDLVGCKTIVSKSEHKIEPRDEIKGKIARVYLYFEETYDYPLSLNQKKLFKSWNDTYPLTEDEKNWIMSINSNLL